ncbi:hypothetical protein D3C81_1802660 [compost metagenome]
MRLRPAKQAKRSWYWMQTVFRSRRQKAKSNHVVVVVAVVATAIVAIVTMRKPALKTKAAKIASTLHRNKACKTKLSKTPAHRISMHTKWQLP